MNRRDSERILSKINVEKYGSMKEMTFARFMGELGNNTYYWIICEMDRYEFLIVSGIEFPREAVNLPGSNLIEVRSAGNSIDERMIYRLEDVVSVYWFDYGYFVFG